ncbi:MAG: hypothetical protein ABWK00_06325 [Desulfurococcaceae archaeon]
MSAGNSRRLECVVCGRKFARGQGITITVGRVVLYFHSSRCAAKFLKGLVERLPKDEVEPYARRLAEEYGEAIRKKRELRAKRI